MFTDALRARLELSIDDASFVVPAGDLKKLEVALEPWGFVASASWWVVVREGGSDPMFASFLGRSLANVKLAVARAFDDPDADAETIVLKGIVTSREVTERAVHDVSDAPVLQRRYAITFADRAQALWTQHHPTSLHVDATLQALVDAHVPAGMTLSHAWTAASESHAVRSVGLGAADDDTSFYDFLHWLLEARGASLAYDPAADSYTIVDSKPEASATPKRLEKDLTAKVRVAFPPTPRSQRRVLNGFADAATRKAEVPNDQAVRGIVRDALLRSPMEDDVGARAAIEAVRACAAGPEWRVTFLRFPAVPLAPGDSVQLDQAWGPSLFASGKTLRGLRASIAARAVDASPGANAGEPTNRYEMDYDVRLETATDAVFRRPAFRVPSWPFHVEGQVVSEVGQDGEDTHEAYADATTSIEQYKIQIPLWGLTVVAGFEPNLVSGHFYFPAYRGQRVLVALWFDRAVIVRFLDWRDGARLPMESQGNALIVGKTTASSTSMRHVYQEGKPALVIARTNGSDVQTIVTKQGTIRIEAREESDDAEG